MGMPDLSAESKFDNNIARTADIEEMTEIINNWLSNYTVDEVVLIKSFSIEYVKRSTKGGFT